MQRDFDIIRRILIDVTNSKDLVSYTDESDGVDVVYNAKLLKNGGYLEGASDKTGFSIIRLTWAGHDLHDAIQDDTVWNRTKDKIGSTVGSASLEVVKAVAEGVSRSMLGLN